MNVYMYSTVGQRHGHTHVREVKISTHYDSYYMVHYKPNVNKDYIFFTTTLEVSYNKNWLQPTNYCTRVWQPDGTKIEDCRCENVSFVVKIFSGLAAAAR